MLCDDNDYDSCNDDDYIELNPDILKEIEHDIKINIIQFYKELLYNEPEFIGIYNISSFEILYIIETTHCVGKLYKKDHDLTDDQIKIYDNMYIDLFKNKSTIDIYNTVTNKIFDKIYV